MRGTLKGLMALMVVLLVAAQAMAITQNDVYMLAIGESTSVGAIAATDPIQTTPPPTCGPEPDYTSLGGNVLNFVPNVVGTNVTNTTGYNLYVENRAESGTKLDVNLLPGRTINNAFLSKHPSRLLYIYSGINDALTTDCGFLGANCKTFTEAVTHWNETLASVVMFARRNGKVPVFVYGAALPTTTTHFYQCKGATPSYYKTTYEAELGMYTSFFNTYPNIIRDGSSQMTTTFRPTNESATLEPCGSSDGIHFTAYGYRKIAKRVSDAISPKMNAIRNGFIVSRWYALELNTPPSKTWMTYWTGRINSVGLDAAAEECYTMLGSTEAQWVQNALTNMGLGTSLYTTYYNWMKSQGTNKHGKLLNKIVTDYINNTETSGINYQARIQMQNKAAVAFAWCYVYNHDTQAAAMTNVTYTDDSVWNGTSSF